MSWIKSIQSYIQGGIFLFNPKEAELSRRRATQFTLIRGRLYKRRASSPLPIMIECPPLHCPFGKHGQIQSLEIMMLILIQNPGILALKVFSPNNFL